MDNIENIPIIPVCDLVDGPEDLVVAVGGKVNPATGHDGSLETATEGSPKPVGFVMADEEKTGEVEVLEAAEPIVGNNVPVEKEIVADVNVDAVEGADQVDTENIAAQQDHGLPAVANKRGRRPNNALKPKKTTQRKPRNGAPKAGGEVEVLEAEAPIVPNNAPVEEGIVADVNINAVGDVVQVDAENIAAQHDHGLPVIVEKKSRRPKNATKPKKATEKEPRQAAPRARGPASRTTNKRKAEALETADTEEPKKTDCQKNSSAKKLKSENQHGTTVTEEKVEQENEFSDEDEEDDDYEEDQPNPLPDFFEENGVETPIYYGACRKCDKIGVFQSKAAEISGTEVLRACDWCKHAYHEACAAYNFKGNDFGTREKIPFRCPKHAKKRNVRARNLRKTNCTAHMEAHLEKHGVGEGKLIVREVAQSLEQFPMPTGAPLFIPPSVEYRRRMLHVFSETPDMDVAFFALQLEEFGDSSHSGNHRIVNVKYIDSLKVLEIPAKERTQLYGRILLSYLEFAGSSGFSSAQIFASPPQAGEEFLFYGRPDDQKNPDVERLAKWYENILAQGKLDGIVKDFHSFDKKNPSTLREVSFFEDGQHLEGLKKAMKKPGQKTEKSLLTAINQFSVSGMYSVKLEVASPPERIEVWKDANTSEQFFRDRDAWFKLATERGWKSRTIIEAAYATMRMVDIVYKEQNP